MAVSLNFTFDGAVFERKKKGARTQVRRHLTKDIRFRWLHVATSGARQRDYCGGFGHGGFCLKRFICRDDLFENFEEKFICQGSPGEIDCVDFP